MCTQAVKELASIDTYLIVTADYFTQVATEQTRFQFIFFENCQDVHNILFIMACIASMYTVAVWSWSLVLSMYI